MRHGEFGEFGGDRIGEPLRGRRAGIGQRLCQFAQFGTQRVPLGGQLADPVVVAVQFGEPAGALLGPGQHRRDVPAVFAGQMVQRGTALLDGGEPQRVGVQTVRVAGQLTGDVRHQNADLAEPLGERGKLLIVAAYGLQRAVRAGDQGGGVDALGVLGIAGQRGMRGGRRRGQCLGVPEPLGLGGEFGVLAGLRLGLRDLVEPETQQIGLL